MHDLMETVQYDSRIYILSIRCELWIKTDHILDHIIILNKSIALKPYIVFSIPIEIKGEKNEVICKYLETK